MERRVTFYEETNFKTTEIGEVPADWEVVKLGDIFEEVDKNERKVEILPDKEYKLVLTKLYANGIQLKEVKYGRDISASHMYLLRAGDFIFSKINVRKGAFDFVSAELDGAVVSTEHPILNIDLKASDPKYVKFFLSQPLVWELFRRESKGFSGKERVKVREFFTVPIPLPPLEEQKAIAYVLSTVQEAREKTEKVTEATKELKKSLMKHLFTYGPVSLEEASRISLKETEIGEIPADWEVVKLGEVALRMKAGGTPHTAVKEFWNGDIPFVLIEDMTGQGVFLSKTKRMITQEGLRNSSAWLVPANSLLVSMYATIGETAINLIPVATNQAIIAIVPRENFDVLYGAYFIKYDSRRLQMQNIQSTQKNVNRAIVENFSIPLPPLSVQKRIAEILQTVDEKTQAEEKKKQALDNLFNSMLHMLMSGKLRVKFQTFEEGASG